MCACLFREFQLSASYEGLIETVPGVNLELLRMDKYEVDPNKDTLFRGEFEVVKELIAAVADGDVSDVAKVSALCTIFTFLLTLCNSDQKNGLLIKLFCFSSDFDETW